MLLAGRKTVAVVGTPEQLAPPGVTGKVLVQALPRNSGAVCVGGPPNVTYFDGRVLSNGPQASTNSQEGFLLNQGESLPLPVNIEDCWIDASIATEGVQWLIVS